MTTALKIAWQDSSTLEGNKCNFCSGPLPAGQVVRAPRKARVKSRGVFYMHNGQKAWAMVRRIGLLYLGGAYLPPQGWNVVEALDGCWWIDTEGNIVRRELAGAVEAG